MEEKKSLYEFVRQGPNGEKVGSTVEGRDVKMNGLITKTGKFIEWSYVKVADRRA